MTTDINQEKGEEEKDKKERLRGRKKTESNAWPNALIVKRKSELLLPVQGKPAPSMHVSAPLPILYLFPHFFTTLVKGIAIIKDKDYFVRNADKVLNPHAT
jgi:hypothetical protein